MAPYSNQQLSGWGHFPNQRCVVFTPRTIDELSDLIAQHPSSLIARGGGRSYGDVAINWEGIISTEHLNSVLSFDEESGIITVQSGMTFKELLDVTLPKGWVPAVIPESKHGTIGGAFATNAIGSNGYRRGAFADHVLSIKLRSATNFLECRPEEAGGVFEATAGGLGLTGAIESLTLQLTPNKSPILQKKTTSVGSIAALLEAFQQHKDQMEHLVGWINPFIKGSKLGQSLFESSQFFSSPVVAPKVSSAPTEPTKSLPAGALALSSFALEWRAKRQIAACRKTPKIEQISAETLFHPLDRYKDWTGLLDKSGVLRCGYIIPEDKHAADRIQHILQLMQNGRQKMFFMRVRMRKGGGAGEYSYQLDIDLPQNKKTLEFLEKIDTQVLEYGGQIDVSEDARLNPSIFTRMYQETLEKWHNVHQTLDPESKFNSALARRLRIKSK